MQDAETQGKSSSTLILVAGLATAAFAAALSRGWQPGIPGEWVWRSNKLPAHLLGALAIGLALVLMTAALCRQGVWQRLARAHRALAFLLLIALVVGLQIALLNAVGIPWVSPGAAIISPAATTYFGVSLGVQSPGDWLAHYHELLPTLPYHAATHPPGFVLFFWGMRKLVALPPVLPSQVLDVLVKLGDTLGLSITRSDALAAVASALLISLIGALGLIPLYLLARSLAGPHAAICATCLAATMPGLLLLGASPDLIVMTLAIGALYRGCQGYGGSWLFAIAAGLLIAVGMFLSLAFGLVAVLACLWGAFAIERSPERSAAIRGVLRTAAIASAALAAAYVALYLTTGYRPVAAAIEALSSHRAVTTVEAARTYWKWALMNPVECAIFAGIPAVVAACWAVPSLRRSPNPGLSSLLAAWLVLFALIDLSGTVRGETGRIWLFLLWPVALSAGAAVSRRRDAGRVTALLVFMQVAQALLMKGYLTIYSIL